MKGYINGTLWIRPNLGIAKDGGFEYRNELL